MSGADRFETWAILELMGHRKLAGYLTEQEIAGQGFLRIDVPTTPPVTQYYHPKAVYGITPTTEETARRAADIGRVAPVHAWELPTPLPLRGAPALEAGDLDADEERF